ncbi:cysteine hydrolase family protein [Streptomyces sp. GC420]|uniref:cysteine hydrolase family protein n=1 Tax=Streptomyces sp. GC420 TaxID=2697568 RepID=UPI001414EC54|nr:isochorismatase family cysteine hydrolase [Streptomyces sp. GC420]NBM15805.1 isochorismatase family protein [Streptomyces sp. GC420]
MTRARTALVLVDLQRWIVDMPWQPTGGDVVIDACGKLREHFASTGSSTVVLVRYVRADGADGGIDAAPNQLVPGLEPRTGETLVTKHGLDAFEGTDLHDRLRREGVTQVVVAGLSTAHGVAATAATALRLGYEVVVVSDATASVDEAQHREALDRLTALGARTGLVSDLVAAKVSGN